MSMTSMYRADPASSEQTVGFRVGLLLELALLEEATLRNHDSPAWRVALNGDNAYPSLRGNCTCREFEAIKRPVDPILCS